MPLGLPWVLKLWSFSWSCSERCALLKIYKLSSRKCSYNLKACTGVYNYSGLSVGAHSPPHKQFTCACWHTSTACRVMLTARGCQPRMPGSQTKTHKIQEFFLSQWKAWCSLTLRLLVFFFPAVFSSMSRTVLAFYPRININFPTTCWGHPPTEVTSANQLCVSDRLVGQSSQHISLLNCRSCLLALCWYSQPVNRSNWQNVVQLPRQSDTVPRLCLLVSIEYTEVCDFIRYWHKHVSLRQIVSLMGLSANSTVMLLKVTEFVTCFLNERLIVRVLQHLYTSMKTHTHQYRHTNNEWKKGQESNLVYLWVREAFFAVLVDWSDLDGCFTAVFADKCVRVQVCLCVFFHFSTILKLLENCTFYWTHHLTARFINLL